MRLPRLYQRLAPFVIAFLLTFPISRAFAAGTNNTLIDPGALSQLEQRAEHASAREQCFLYTELVQGYTQVAGKQMAEGEMDQASATLKLVQSYATRIHVGLARDTKRLKNAEKMMHAAARSLGEYLHHVSIEDKAVVESTLKQLEKVNDELLAQVFAH
jgi:hypothetical protein